MSVLLVAAEPREFRGLLRRSRRIERLDLPVYWARAAWCGGRRFLLLANGAGAVRASAAVSAALTCERPSAVVSTGFCGALDPALEPGDVFVATRVEAAGRSFPAADPGAHRPYSSGPLVTVERVAGTAGQKTRLRAATGAGAVEMEAAGVAVAACDAGLPFFCVRSVTDRATESFALDYDAILQADGHLDTILLLSSICRKPVAALPEVIGLWRRCRAAAETLGAFIADCRF